MNHGQRVQPAPVFIDLNELITGMVNLLTRLLGSDIAISTDLDPRLDPVKGDPKQLEQVVMNLALNARDAMPKGGRFTIRTGSEVVSSGNARYPDLPGGWYVSLTVADTGCGMTDEVKSRIFEPFFTTKPVGKGTGLGLAMVHGIVRLHGGAIFVESTVGVGTTFELLFPFGDDADAPIVVTR